MLPVTKGRRVKKIEAIIKPFKLDDVKDALHEVGPQPILRVHDVLFLGRGSGGDLLAFAHSRSPGTKALEAPYGRTGSGATRPSRLKRGQTH